MENILLLSRVAENLRIIRGSKRENDNLLPDKAIWTF